MFRVILRRLKSCRAWLFDFGMQPVDKQLDEFADLAPSIFFFEYAWVWVFVVFVYKYVLEIHGVDKKIDLPPVIKNFSGSQFNA